MLLLARDTVISKLLTEKQASAYLPPSTYEADGICHHVLLIMPEMQGEAGGIPRKKPTARYNEKNGAKVINRTRKQHAAVPRQFPGISRGTVRRVKAAKNNQQM